VSLQKSLSETSLTSEDMNAETVAITNTFAWDNDNDMHRLIDESEMDLYLV
jgi:hypothetical protein